MSVWLNRIEHPTSNREVLGSSPSSDLVYFNTIDKVLKLFLTTR